MSTDKTYRLLLVEDQDDIRKVFSLILSKSGFEVFDFATAPEALEHCQTQLPVAAIFDVDLGGKDGMELGVQIRSLPGGDKVVIATLTGNDTVDCARKSRELGFDFHFVKPIPMKDVCQSIRAKLEPERPIAN